MNRPGLIDIMDALQRDLQTFDDSFVIHVELLDDECIGTMAFERDGVVLPPFTVDLMDSSSGSTVAQVLGDLLNNNDVFTQEDYFPACSAHGGEHLLVIKGLGAKVYWWCWVVDRHVCELGDLSDANRAAN
jgi:hypothetical protein